MGVYIADGTTCWSYSFKLRGRKQQRGSTEIPHNGKLQNKKLALEVYNKIRAASAAQRHGIDPVGWTINQLIDWAWTNFWSRKPKQTRESVDLALASFVKVFGTKKAANITVEEIRKYRSDRELTVKFSTTNRELSKIKFAYARAIQDKHLAENPLESITRTNEDSLKRSRNASPEEQAYLLDRSHGTFHWIIRFALATGLRQGEIRALQRTDIDWINHEFKVVSWKGGRKTERYIPFDLSPEIEATFREMDNPFPWVFHNGDGKMIPKDGLIHSAWPRLCQKLGIEDLHFHDLRHTFATELWRKNRNIIEVHNMLGHEKLETTMTYINVKKVALGRSAEKNYHALSKKLENEVEVSLKIV